ncbi:hypothetical protein ACOMHN_009088 [Nucella lapillus]
MQEKHGDYIKNAKVLKSEGNAEYKAHSFKAAIRKYHRALFFLRAVGLTVESEFGALTGKSDSVLPAKMLEEKEQLKSACYNNLAACILAQAPLGEGDYQRVVGHCQSVLQVDGDNAKATYRMATALFHLGHLDRAREVLNSHTDLTADKQVQTLLKLIQDKEKAQDEKLKATYQKMFQSHPAAPSPKAEAGQTHADPILIMNGVTRDSGNRSASSAQSAAANQNGAKLIHVASAEKEAVC